MTAWNRTHGMSNTKLFAAWAGMIARCTNPSHTGYPRYGGRGITVCERWMTFANFYADMGERPVGHTLDRIDNDKGYSPDNCRWATISEQNRNRTLPRLDACRSGHPYVEGSYRTEKSGKRSCLACCRRWAAEHRARQRAAS